MIEINTYANNKFIEIEKIRKWEEKRMKNVYDILNLVQNKQNLNNLAELKIAIGEDEIRNKLNFSLNISNFISKIISFLSFGKRKYSIVEIEINNIELQPIEFIHRLNLIMLNNDTKYNKMRLRACPDHYLISNTNENEQEVIETTGGSPFPAQIYITYDDEEGLQSKKDSTYDEQIFGVARSKNGTIIGGVRHQVKKELNGLKIKLLVEFPALILNYMIKEHQIHLMCEFNNWIRDIINDSNFN